MNSIKYSVIVPVYNDHIQLEKLLNNLLQQKKIPEEVIIIDSSDIMFDDSFLKNKEYESLNIYYERINSSPPYSGKNFNYGITKAKNDYIAFLDTKTIPSSKWIFDYDSFFLLNELF